MMYESNRKAAIQKVITADGTELEGEDIPFKTDDPGFFNQEFYCNGRNQHNVPCRARAAAKTKHHRTSSAGKETVVNGNFHLALQATHIPECSYDIMAQAYELHATHQDTIKRLENTYVLTVPTFEDYRLGIEHESEDAAEQAPHLLHTTHPTGRTKPALQRVTQTAAAILELFHRFDDDDEAKKLFRIKYAGKTYSWGEFFFSANTDARKLYTTVQKSTINDQPRLLVVYGKVGAPPKRNKKNGYSIWIPNGVKATVPGTKKVINLYIHISDQQPPNLHEDQKILAIGQWRIGGSDKTYLSVSATADSYATYSHKN